MAEPNVGKVQDVAREIAREWGAKVHYAAVPYLRELCQAQYLHDGPQSCTRYFLSNAGSFRGPKARELKAALKEAAGV